MIFQLITWLLGAIAAYRLWENHTWLAIAVAVLAYTYGARQEENAEHDVKGQYSELTAARFMFTFVAVAGIFIYSLFV